VPGWSRASARAGGRFLNCKQQARNENDLSVIRDTNPFASVWDLAKHIHGQNVEVCARSQRKRHAEDGRGRAHTMRN
jgi:hypothetical protein